MKKILLFIVLFQGVLFLNAQQPPGKEISELAGANILRLLPEQMKGKGANKDRDKVFRKQGFIGVTVHRDYNGADNRINVEVINKSPSVAAVNSLIQQTGANTSGKYKTTTISGYKVLIQRMVSENGSTIFELLIPIKNTLLVLEAGNVTEEELITMANTIPVTSIADYL